MAIIAKSRLHILWQSLGVTEYLEIIVMQWGNLLQFHIITKLYITGSVNNMRRHCLQRWIPYCCLQRRWNIR